MPTLLVRGVAEKLVRALKERIGAHGRSTEAEHRDTLAASLTRPCRRAFAEVLASMPAVSDDTDFERPATVADARVSLIGGNIVSKRRKQARGPSILRCRGPSWHATLSIPAYAFPMRGTGTATARSCT